jgi:hypothetical protein
MTMELAALVILWRIHYQSPMPLLAVLLVQTLVALQILYTTLWTIRMMTACA